MNRSGKISFIALALLAAASCTRILDPDEAFLASSEVQLKVKGTVVHTYDPLTGQLGCNVDRKEFRVSDDAMKSGYTVSCSSLPRTVGQKLDATVSWTQGGGSHSESGEFEVVKADRDTCWLWCGHKKKQIAVTVCLLR